MKTKLREIRVSRNYTQLKVAMDLHLNQNSVSRYESGARELSGEMLLAFADYYHVSVDYILCRTENPEILR